MKFLFPEFIYMMLIPAAVLIYLISTNRDVVERIFDAKTLERLRISGDGLGRAGHNTLMFLSFFFMTLALAQPVIEQGEQHVKTRGVDLVIALDLSDSMKAADFYPNRLEFAKQKLKEVLPKFPAGRIGLVGFTTSAFIIAPLTTDRESLAFLLERVSPDMVTAKGTKLSSAIAGAAKLLEKSSDRLMLLVTDGGETALEPLVKQAKEHHLRVIVWMVATSKGAPIPFDSHTMIRKGEGEIVVSRANTKLERLASETEGIYVDASLSQSDEKRIIEFLKNVSADSKTYEKIVHRRIELFYYPLVLALVILPFALYSVGMGRRRAAGFLIVLMISGIHTESEAGVLDFILIEKGEKAYRKGDYKASTDAFEKLAVHTPKSEVWFDLGNSYYRSGRYKMACDAYEKVVTSDRTVEQAKLYNMANCQVKLGTLERAAALYRKVLALGEDPDARYNLELVMKALRENPKEGKGSKGEKEKKKEKRHSSAASASNERSQTPGMNRKRTKTRKLSQAEEKKWMRLIARQPLKSKLYPLTQPEEDSDVDPW